MTKTFHFTDLPKRLIYASEGYTLSKWTRGVEKDILAEIGNLPPTTWVLEENDFVVLQLHLKEDETETVRCLLHNLHGGKIVNN